MQKMYDPSIWDLTLNCLRGQRDYLEELLSKTATTLNALRDRQTRNERVLSTHPTPRSKRKKIQQNRWRTDKTIQTCENEERVILDCLQVCESNIRALEAIIPPPDISWTSAEHYSSNSYADSDTESLDWQGWTEDAPGSPFKKDRKHPLPMDEIPPETPLLSHTEVKSKHSPPLPPRSDPAPSSTFPSVPPNSARTNFTFSPEATEFEPSAAHRQQPITLVAQELDKLTISGFLAAKRKCSIQRRRFSDVAINNMIGRLPSNVRPSSTPAGTYQSWAAPSPLRQHVSGQFAEKANLKRSNSM